MKWGWRDSNGVPGYGNGWYSEHDWNPVGSAYNYKKYMTYNIYPY